jgi:hypothetical protein
MVIYELLFCVSVGCTCAGNRLLSTSFGMLLRLVFMPEWQLAGDALSGLLQFVV